MKYKFIKPFSSFVYCMNNSNSTKDKWKMALRDPAYLVLWSINISLTIYAINSTIILICNL